MDGARKQQSHQIARADRGCSAKNRAGKLEMKATAHLFLLVSRQVNLDTDQEPVRESAAQTRQPLKHTTSTPPRRSNSHGKRENPLPDEWTPAAPSPQPDLYRGIGTTLCGWRYPSSTRRRLRSPVGILLLVVTAFADGTPLMPPQSRSSPTTEAGFYSNPKPSIA